MIYVHHFLNTLNSVLPNCNFKFLNNNIKTVKIEKFSYVEQKKNINIAAYYDAINNILKIPNNIMDNIFHELFHMASTIYVNDYLFSGFQVISFEDKLLIGKCLNEGYTQLLTDRYFKFSTGLELEKKYAYSLEKILGEETMTSSYFKADLSQLINDMSKYNSRDESIKFIINLDLLMRLTRFLKIKSKEDINKIKICINNLNDYLIKSYTNKLKSLNISEDVINIKLSTLELINFDNDIKLKKKLKFN